MSGIEVEGRGRTCWGTWSDFDARRGASGPTANDAGRPNPRRWLFLVPYRPIYPPNSPIMRLGLTWLITSVLLVRSARAVVTAERPLEPASSNVTNATPWSPLTAEGSGVEAIKALVVRRLPERLHETFTFVLDASLADAASFDTFKLARRGSKIHITGVTTSALSRGLLTYLRSIGGDSTW